MPYDSIELNLRMNRMPFFYLMNKTKEKQKLKKKLVQFNQYLQTFGLCFSSVQVVNSKNRVINDKINDFEFTIEEKSYEDDKLEFAAICQNARDKASMSNRAYKIFRETIKPFVRIETLTRCVSYKLKVDNFWPLKTNARGAFIADPSSKISYVCSKYLKQQDMPYQAKNIKNNTFNILLCGDGFQLTKTNRSVFNFAFCLLNDGDQSHNGFYTLGLFKIEKEDYNSLKECIEELVAKLSEIKQININNHTYDIKFSLGGDLKWMATVLGINSANSNFPCLWCEWKSEPIKETDRINQTEKLINAKWSINGRDHQTAALLMNEKTSEKRKGYLKESLFKFIEFNNCVVDPLHLMLRISDKLFELLLFRLESLDKKQTTFKPNNHSTRILTLTFLEYLKNEKTGCNLTEPYFYHEDEKRYKLRKLNQNERNNIFQKIKDCSLCDIFPKKFRNDKILMKIEDLFKEFFHIMELIKIDYNEEDLNKDELDRTIKEWLRKLVSVNDDITPYTHILCFHVIEFIDNFRNLNLFSMQGLEKSNHVIKNNYFRQTNHKKDFTSLLLKKMNRMEFLHLKGRLEDKNDGSNFELPKNSNKIDNTEKQNMKKEIKEEIKPVSINEPKKIIEKCDSNKLPEQNECIELSSDEEIKKTKSIKTSSLDNWVQFKSKRIKMSSLNDDDNDDDSEELQSYSEEEFKVKKIKISSLNDDTDESLSSWTFMD